jgi:hypothetical protein
MRGEGASGQIDCKSHFHTSRSLKASGTRISCTATHKNGGTKITRVLRTRKQRKLIALKGKKTQQ